MVGEICSCCKGTVELLCFGCRESEIIQAVGRMFKEGRFDEMIRERMVNLAPKPVEAPAQVGHCKDECTAKCALWVLCTDPHHAPFTKSTTEESGKAAEATATT